MGAGPAAGRAAPEDWGPTGLGGGVVRLHTPASGAFLAETRDRQGADGLSRSDDGGETWADVGLPPPPASVIAVDPTNHDVL